jgi:DNA-binding NarL/FixJ family response regulator
MQSLTAQTARPAETLPAAPAPVRVAVIEDSPDWREMLERLFAESPGIECLGTFPTAESALKSLPGLRPHVVLMDINLPGLDGIECVRQLKTKLPATLFVMLTVYENTERIFQAVQAGASGYLLKRTAPADILQAVRDARNGGAPMTGFIARKVLDAFRAQLPQAVSPAETVELSAREQQVLEKLAKGFLVKEIAEQLGIGFGTVHTYTLRIYEKLHVRSRAEAAARYFRDHQQ